MYKLSLSLYIYIYMYIYISLSIYIYTHTKYIYIYTYIYILYVYCGNHCFERPLYQLALFGVWLCNIHLTDAAGAYFCDAARIVCQFQVGVPSVCRGTY